MIGKSQGEISPDVITAKSDGKFKPSTTRLYVLYKDSVRTAQWKLHFGHKNQSVTDV